MSADHQPHDHHDRRADGGDALRDDVVHGLLVAHASEHAGGVVGRVQPARRRAAARWSLGPIAAMVLIAVTLGVLVPLSLNGSPANASAVLASAESTLAESGARTYEIRITRWGGPAASRMMVGEVTLVPGTPAQSTGYIELDDAGHRVEFGRDADGPWFKGSDGVVRRHAPRGNERQSGEPQRMHDGRGPQDGHGAGDGRGVGDGRGAGEGRAGGAPFDVDWLTLDAVLPKLRKGYDMQVVEYPRWRTLIARRQWMPDGIDAKALADRAALRAGTELDADARNRAGAARSGAGDANPEFAAPQDVADAASKRSAFGPAWRGAPLRVELEFAPDGRVIERARIEFDAPRAPRTVELRLKSPGDPAADDDAAVDFDLGTWE